MIKACLNDITNPGSKSLEDRIYDARLRDLPCDLWAHIQAKAGA